MTWVTRKLCEAVYLLVPWLTFGLVFPAWGDTPIKGRHASHRPITVQLNWRHQFEFAAFYAAVEKGYYRAEGLDVRIREGGPGVDPVQEVLAGRAAFGVANSSLILERARQKPVVALAALMQHSAFALLARRDQGIENVTDLDGKRVACAPHACDEIRAYLATSGLPEGRVRFVSPSTTVADSLKNSEAVDIFISNQGYEIIGREYEYVLFTPRSVGIDIYGDILFTTDNQVGSGRRTVEAFTDATKRGLQYALDHPDELIDLILERYNSQNKSREHLAYEAKKLFELIRPDLVDPGYMSLGRWQHVRDVYASIGMVPGDFPVEELIYQPKQDLWLAWLKWIIAALAVAYVVTLALSLWQRRINQALQREISERHRAELALKAEQDGFRRFVEQANSLVAHELRTPLASLKVHLDVLQLKKSADGDGESNLSAMKQAVLRLETLFEKNLKQVFTTTKFFQNAEFVDLRAAIENLVNYQNTLSEAQRIRFESPSAATCVRMAPEMIDTVVTNLLENALKYSPENTDIKIRLMSVNELLKLEVFNYSVVPLPEDPEILFEKNNRGMADPRQAGTGVGLYLVRLIVLAHHGTVSIKTEQPDGFAIHVSLPAAIRDPVAEFPQQTFAPLK